MHHRSFAKHDLESGHELFRQGKVDQVIFSSGTYQMEVIDQEEAYWPFLQIDDFGQVLDAFCHCENVESSGSCPHLGAAYYKIFLDKRYPLHLSFRSSFWNHFCQIGFKRHGLKIEKLERTKSGNFQIKSAEGRKVFSLKSKKETAERFFQECLVDRVEETEETSIKFSNLPKEELELYRNGTPSLEFAYELSYWSDLAKHLFLQQEKGDDYSIKAKQEKGRLPEAIEANFSECSIEIFIAKTNWDCLILSLKNTDSLWQVYEYRNLLVEKVLFCHKEKSFELFSNTLELDFDNLEGVIEVSGDWLYHSEIGFFTKAVDPMLYKDKLFGEDVTEMLYKHPNLLKAKLENCDIYEGVCFPSYELTFDENEDFHIKAYLFKPGDLTSPSSCRFGSWFYIHGLGFYEVNLVKFSESDKIIRREEMNSFISQRRLWLNTFDGFQTHLTNIEISYSYKVNEDQSLEFVSTSDAFTGIEGAIDFGEWVYINNRGFYAKASTAKALTIPHFKKIPKDQVSAFIESNEDELEFIKNFFSAHQPVLKSGISINLLDDGSLEIEPMFRLKKGYVLDQLKFFGKYTFVKGEGFAKLPSKNTLPSKYVKKKIIPESMQEKFFLKEYSELKPFFLHVDKRLKKPKHLFLKVESIEYNQAQGRNELSFILKYKSEYGAHLVSDFFKDVRSEKKSVLKTPAGLFFAQDARIQWLRQLSQEKIEGDRVKLSLLEWMRLQALEEIEAPDEKKSLELFKYLKEFRAEDTLNLEGLKSRLRPYQEVGSKWLWFLYLHNLSGLLCDEMGLGKTHQAMSLITAALNESSHQCKKFLIVCPTSVIYHWEKLLQMFLPKARVLVFYGIQRTLKGFCDRSDILLTSYGTLRSEKEALSKVEFKIAILDELQTAKNSASQTHKALKGIKAGMKLGLTGTPIENRLQELHALFDIVLPGYLPSESEYKEQFVTPIEKTQDKEKIEILKGLIKPFILRRKKEEVLDDLPEKIEEVSYTELSKDQMKLYKEAFEAHRKDLLQSLQDEKKPVPYLHIFSLFNTLKQICDHPALYYKKPQSYQAFSSGKWELFKELLEEARDSGQKVVVFSQYLHMLDIIGCYLKQKSIEYAEIRGSTKNRREQLIKFQQDRKCEVFLGSLQASGVGIELTAASVVIHYDRWWNPAKENQATDRVHRIGQNRGVQVFKLVTKNTIEEHIHNLIEKKKGLTKQIIGYDDQDQVKHLGREELINLFKTLNKKFSL